MKNELEKQTYLYREKHRLINSFNKSKNKVRVFLLKYTKEKEYVETHIMSILLDGFMLNFALTLFGLQLSVLNTFALGCLEWQLYPFLDRYYGRRDNK